MRKRPSLQNNQVVRGTNPDLEDVFHGLLCCLFSPCAQRGSQTKNLWQRLLPVQLFLHVATHYLVVDSLLFGVVTLVDDQQCDICQERTEGLKLKSDISASLLSSCCVPESSTCLASSRFIIALYRICAVQMTTSESFTTCPKKSFSSLSPLMGTTL